MTKHTTEDTIKPMTCPYCGSTNVGKYLYGFPGMNQKMMQVRKKQISIYYHLGYILLLLFH